MDMVNDISSTQEEIFADFPVIDILKCRYCGVCSGYCPEKAIQFNRFVPSVTLIVAMCFGCSECFNACDHKGIRMQKKLSGTIHQGSLGQNYFIAGRLADATEFKLPLVNALTNLLLQDATVICDFGPGNDNAVSAGLTDLDMAVVVLQPENGWEQNLTSMLNITELKTISTGVILNKVNSGSEFVNDIKVYCLNHSIPLLGIIPYDKRFENHSDFQWSTRSEFFNQTFSVIWKSLHGFSPVFKSISNETLNNIHIIN